MSSSLYRNKHVIFFFKQKFSVAKVVQVYISKLNAEMIDILRQLYFSSTLKALYLIFNIIRLGAMHKRTY